ncbi:MAG: fasciclin domain-containing protein [Chloroflexota bacterium]
MFRKLVLSGMFVAFALLTTIAVGQGTSDDQVFLRVLQAANDNTTVSFTLQDGRTVLSNFAPGSVSDYLPYELNRSTLVTVTITPPGGVSFAQEWAVPPLTSGHHTAAVVGSGRDNTLELIFIDEDTLCAGKLESGSCIILVNSIKNSPLLNISANSTPVIEEARYRQVVVGDVPAASYFNFTAVDENNPQAVVFRLQLQYFEPNVIYLYTLRGNYPARRASDYIIGSVRRVPVDTMTFLRGLTADLQLSDGNTLFAAENIVAVLEEAGLDQLLANTSLPMTVFVPLDEAVVEGAPDLYQCAIDNPAALRALILNHVLVGGYTAAQLVGEGTVPSLAGTSHSFRGASGGFFVDNQVFVPDSRSYPTSSGNAYLIDDLLVPNGFENRYCTQG